MRAANPGFPLRSLRARGLGSLRPSIVKVQWSRGDSNPGPPPCKGGALPAKLRPPESSRGVFTSHSKPGVGAPGLEPGTSALSGPRSNHLSYAPVTTCVMRTRPPERLPVSGIRADVEDEAGEAFRADPESVWVGRPKPVLYMPSVLFRPVSAPAGMSDDHWPSPSPKLGPSPAGLIGPTPDLGLCARLFRPVMPDSSASLERR